MKRNREKPRADAVALYLKEQSDEPSSMVTVLCEKALTERQILDHFRRELMRKLDKHTYPYPSVPGRRQDSFLSIIRSKRAEPRLLCVSALKELGSCLLVREVARKYKEFSKARRSEAGYPVKFHRNMLRTLDKHLDRIRDSMKRNRVPEDWARPYFDALWAQIGKDARAVISYEKKGSLQELLHPHRSPSLVTDLALHGVLRRLIGKHMPNRFLQQLAMLISGSLEERGAKSFEIVEENLRRAIARQRMVDKRSRKKLQKRRALSVAK